MGHSSRSTGKPCTPGWGLKAKAPSLWEDGNKGTQRTRKLSTGGLPWSWRNGNRRFMVFPWRSTKGVKPDALKGASPVLNLPVTHKFCFRVSGGMLRAELPVSVLRSPPDYRNGV